MLVRVRTRASTTASRSALCRAWRSGSYARLVPRHTARRLRLRRWLFASGRKLVYPGRTLCWAVPVDALPVGALSVGALSVLDPPKMLARNTPAGHFQFSSATVIDIGLSAKEIDTTASLEPCQNVQDIPGGDELQQSAVADPMLVK